MTDQERQRITAEHTAYIDNHGRRDLNGGIGYVLIAAVLICLPLIAALIWRAFG